MEVEWWCPTTLFSQEPVMSLTARPEAVDSAYGVAVHQLGRVNRDG